MSSKRKWDQAGDEGSSSHKAQKAEDSKSASEAAAAAAAIAAKIAAQFAGGSGGSGGSMLGPKDPHDGAFIYDIDINDVRNRYLLTRGSTQEQVCPCIESTDSSCLILFIADQRRNGSFSDNEGCLVSRSPEGNR